MRIVLALAVVAGLLLVAACETEDTTAPTVSIVSPVGGDTLAKGNIVIKAVATDNKAVAKVEFYQNGTILGTDNVGGAGDTFRYTWSDTATQTGGAHALTAKAYDNASTPNMTTSAAVTIYIAGGGGGTGPTEHSGDIRADETWWASGNPHIITGDIDVTDNATLTIKPGCMIECDPGVEIYAGYYGPGSIVAEGTADSAITFTSNVPSPSPGDWVGISACPLAMNTTSFKYCVIEYGGSGSSRGEVLNEHDGLKFGNNTVRKSQYCGVYCSQTTGFTGFNNNTITGCGTYPLHLQAEVVKSIGTGNTLTGNIHDAVEVADNSDVKTSGTWPNTGVPYVIAGDINIGDDANNPVVTIAPGTVLKMNSGVEFYVGYYAPGGLIADGTTGRITFTSNVGPARGDWRSLSFYDLAINSQCKLINCNIEYAGGYSNGGNLHIENCTPTVTGDSIGHSLHYGIHLGGSEHPDSAALEAGNTFYDNPDGNIYQ
jgi:hypothetical protein